MVEVEQRLGELIIENRHIRATINREYQKLSQLTAETSSKFAVDTVERQVQANWSRFEINNFEIIKLPEANQNKYITERVYEVVEDIYLKAVFELGRLIKEFSNIEKAEGAGRPAVQYPPMKLPNIDLPTFSGDILQWETFRDMFLSLVHRQPVYTNVQKLSHLLRHLSGDAEELLKNTPITDAHSEAAWNSLVIRYGNQRILSYIHMKSLAELPPAANSSAAEIKRVIDFVQQTVRSFVTLGKPIAEWNEWFVFYLSSKLDVKTRIDWETSLQASSEVPPFQNIVDFLENRLQALTACSNIGLSNDNQLVSTENRAMQNRSRPRNVAAAFTKHAQTPKCLICSQAHQTQKCSRYLNLDVHGRMDLVKSKKLCTNCLASGHFRSRCPSTGRCRTCGGLHHTTIHKEESHLQQDQRQGERITNAVAAGTVESLQSQGGQAAIESASKSSSSGAFVSNVVTRDSVLLATAIVRVIAPSGRNIQARALLDPGADTSFISQSLAQNLGLKLCKTQVAVLGFASSEALNVKHLANFYIENATASFKMEMQALVRSKLNFVLPTSQVISCSWPHIQGLKLADPEFATLARIDVLIGADYLNSVYLEDRVKGPSGTPDAYLTQFGYVLLGPTGQRPALSRVYTLHTLDNADICKELQRFWEIEEVERPRIFLPEDQICEDHFKRTHSRDESGRYIVRLPLRQPTGSLLSGTRPRALALYRKLEDKFARNEAFEAKYRDFMKEYLSLNHMRLVSGPRHPHPHYIPHHGVFKKHDTKEKIRVVFNASAKTASGQSLNSLLHTGPKLQTDLWVIVLRWRMFQFVYAADCVKFYRQILVHPEDCHLQWILFCLEEGGDVQDFELATLTYGTAPAQFLALRVVEQLIADEGKKFPRAVVAIRKNKYIDDYLLGADTIEELQQIRAELTQLLQAGGFEPARWTSNFQEQDPATTEPVVFEEREGIKTLGISWDPRTDAFKLRVPLSESLDGITKKAIFSDSASIFDVLGRKAPVTVIAKIFMQDVWLSGHAWDQVISGALLQEWLKIREELKEIENDEDDRWLGTSARGKLQDRRRRRKDHNVASHLQNQGSPHKTLSIPKLELSAALLLATLMDQLKKNLDLGDAEFFAWSDAQVALTWIRSHTSRWQPFVANRVSQIQSITDVSIWNYVPTDQNPADLATRGMSANELRQSELWKHGPGYLTKDPSMWPTDTRPQEDERANKELRSRMKICTAVTGIPEWEIFGRYSSLTKLNRIVALVMMFIENCRRRLSKRSRRRVLKVNMQNFVLTAERIRRAFTLCIQISQKRSFPAEFEALSRKRRIAAQSPMLNLRPFCGEDGCIRVGGRLQRANLSYDEMHPYIIAKNTSFDRLLVRNAHLVTLHGETQLTHRHIASIFWILHGRSLVRSIVRGCVKCARLRAQPIQQIMAQLPDTRVKPQRPFLRSGVDYAGPILVKASAGRGQKACKAYICLFVCLSTKAIHLEVAVDSSVQGFISAFRRFISHRGRCAELHSDNGTNFRGSSTELKKMFSESSGFYARCAKLLADEGTEWKFIPPSAPHFGGIWEAGVKSAKYHLRRVIGPSKLTFEEMSTLLAQVEACLKSRPITALSADSRDLVPLTPGHFLIGEPLTSIPEPPIPGSAPLTKKYLQVTRMRDDFWRRWKTEYLHELQVLSKWKQNKLSVELGNMVVIKEDNTPLAKWLMGRIVRTFPDREGVVRKAEVMTSTGQMLRPIHKLVLLPVKSDV